MTRDEKRDKILKVLYLRMTPNTPMPMDWVFWREQVADEILEALGETGGWLGGKPVGGA